MLTATTSRKNALTEPRYFAFSAGSSQRMAVASMPMAIEPQSATFHSPLSWPGERPDRSVTEVALACGFSSSQYFATLFRNRFGL